MANNKKKLIRAAALILTLATLPGCLPLTTPTLIGLVLDGFSFMATGKSVTDHAISQVAQRDCSVGRAVFTGSDICTVDDQPPIIALGEISDDTPLALAPAAGNDVEPDLQVMTF